MKKSSAPKRVTIDPTKFDPLQICVLDAIAADIKSGLEEAGLKGAKLQGLTENLTFAVAAVVDGSRVMQLDGEWVTPVLTFAADEKGDRLIGADGGSWMHEYAFGAAEQLFAKSVPPGPRLWILRMEFPSPVPGKVWAHKIRIDVTKPKKALLAELAADTKYFRDSGRDPKTLIKAMFVSPEDRKTRFDVQPLIASGFKTADLYAAFMHASRHGF
ncbi:MAG TPA: hypothetical protein VHD32_01680 [Candidatus Didemnitutus sp.]|nr:hypothetical protein [Candidatus Didemnitutus sp.]